MEIKEKLCSNCNLLKPESEFYRKNSKRLQSYCKPCFNSYCIARWHSTKIKAINLLGGKCVDCLNTYPPEVYQFHHLDPKTKDFNWTKGRLKSFDKIEKELKKCVLLCANCHVIRHSKYGIPTPI